MHACMAVGKSKVGELQVREKYRVWCLIPKRQRLQDIPSQNFKLQYDGFKLHTEPLDAGLKYGFCNKSFCKDEPLTS